MLEAGEGTESADDEVERFLSEVRRLKAPILGLVTSLCLATGQAAAQAQQPVTDSAEYRLYAASVAAAGALVRLHETEAARYWLDAAPEGLRGWEWRYLDAEADRSTASFEAAAGTVTDLSIHPGGDLLAVAGDAEVSLWSVGSGELVARLGGHNKTTWNARFSPQGERLATVSSDGTLRVWRLADRTEALRIDDIGGGVSGVAWHPSGEQLATVSWQRSEERGVWGVIDVWDAGTGERIRHFDHGVKPVTSVSFASAGTRLIVASWDFDVAVYDVEDGEMIAQWLPADDGVYKAVRESRPSPDGSLLAAAHDDGAVRIWDVRSGNLVHVLHRQAEGTRLAQNDVVWFADGGRVAAASADQTVRIWDANSGEHLQVLHGHTEPVTALALTPDGKTLFSGDVGGVVRRWDLASVSPDRVTWQLPGTGYSAAVSHDGRRVASTGWGGWIVLVELETGRRIGHWQGHEVSGVRAAWSSGDRLLATTGSDELVKVWDPSTDPPVLVFQQPVGMQSLGVAFSADGSLLASPAAGTSVHVWTATDGKQVAALDEGVAFTDVDWHPEDALLAASAGDGVVRLWRPAGGEEPVRLEGHGEGMLQAAFSPDGTLLAAVSAGGSIRVWHVASRSVVQEMRASSGGQLALAWAPDGRRLATGGNDNRVHVWDASRGIRLLDVPFSESPWDVGWSRDGSALLTVPLDGTVRVLRAGKE